MPRTHFSLRSNTDPWLLDDAVQIGYPGGMALFKEKKRLEDEVAVVPRQPATNSQLPKAPQGLIMPNQPTVMGQPYHPSNPPVQAQPVQVAAPGYGVDQLMKLMRELPSGNVELVVRVLKKTLESVRISVPVLIQDAARRESELDDKMAGHRRTIAALEDEVASKKRSIEDLEMQYREVMMVKERLNLALTLDQQEISVRPVRADSLPHDEIVHTPVVTNVTGRGPNTR